MAEIPVITLDSDDDDPVENILPQVPVFTLDSDDDDPVENIQPQVNGAENIMMESSEQPPYYSCDPEDCSLEGARVFLANKEDCTMPFHQNDQVNEEIRSHMENNHALILSNSQRIPLKGEHLTFAQNSENEMVVLFNNMQVPSIAHALSQGFSVNSDNNPASAMHYGLNNLGTMSTEGIPVRRNDGLQNIDKNRTDSIHCSSEALLEEGTRQLVFFPRETKIMPINEYSGFLEFTGSIRPATVTSKLSGKKETGSANEGPIILSPTYIDSYSSKMEDRLSALNKENNNNSLPEEYVSSVVETSSPTIEEKLSMPPLDVDLAVSVTHTAAPILDHDWKIKNILEDKKQNEETGQSKLALPTKSPNVIYFEFSNAKELDFLIQKSSELFSESPLIEELSNHSDLKGGSDFSNKNDNANFTTYIVKKTVDEDNNEPIHFPSQLQSSGSINEDSVDFDQSQNLENIFYQSSKQNEMNYTNSEGACSETQTCMERTFLSMGDNSKLKSSFFSDNSQSKDHNLHLLKKMKPVNPSEVKDMDVYDFQTGSSNLDPELSDNSSLDRQCYDSVNPDEAVDMSKDIQLVNSNLEGATGNLTFQGILTAFTDDSKFNKNLTDGKNSETYYDNPQYSLNQDPQHKGEHIKLCKNNKNSVFSETNCTNEDKICNENSFIVKYDVNIDNESQEDTSIGLDFDRISVIPPKHTYGRKKKASDTIRNIQFFCDDFYDNISNSTPKILSLDNEKEQILIENNLPDEDGYVNFINPNIKIESVRESTFSMNIANESKENDAILSNIATSDKLTVLAPQKTYACKKKTSDEKEQDMIYGYGSPDEDGYVNFFNPNIKIRINPPVDESTISLRPESSDQNLLKEIPDFVMKPEDLGDAFRGTYLISPSSTEKTEVDAPSASSPDFPKAASRKKKMQTLSFENIDAKIDSNKSKSSIKMKDASFDNRKIEKKLKKKIKKTVRNSKNFSCSSVAMVHKRCQPSKDRVKRGKTAKTCGNDYPAEKNNCASDGLITPSTSTQEFDNILYSCYLCSFESYVSNNISSHLKYYHRKPPLRWQWSRTSSGSRPVKFPRGTVFYNRLKPPTTSEVLDLASDGNLNKTTMSTKQHYHQ